MNYFKPLGKFVQRILKHNFPFSLVRMYLVQAIFRGTGDVLPLRQVFDVFLEARLKHMETVLARRDWPAGTFSVAAIRTAIQRIANVESAQMLVESQSRAVLQKFLWSWLPVLRATKVQGLIRWAMDVDPLSIL
jgi:Primosomal protein N C-terminal domain